VNQTLVREIDSSVQGRNPDALGVVDPTGAECMSSVPDSNEERMELAPGAARRARSQASLAARARAALAPPTLSTFSDRNRGDNEGGDRVEPPPAKEGVPEKAKEDGTGEVGAEQVLGALAAGGNRTKLVTRVATMAARTCLRTAAVGRARRLCPAGGS
jgi:hypothetical protein